MVVRVLVALLALVGVASCRSAPEPTTKPILVFSSNGVKALLEDLRPELERMAGRSIALEFSTTADLQRRIEGGDRPDVAVLTTAAVEALSARGLLAPASSRPVAQVGVGVGVRTQAPTADVSTPDALRALVLGARSVTFTAEGQSRPAIDAAFERLGIVDAMRKTTVLRGPGEAPGAVARGESDVVITLVSEMVGVPGLKVLGPLPPDLQRHVTFAAARSTSASDVAAADRVLEALSGADVTARLARHGLEPAGPR
jgi:molybdate transport system substrate-binding protein